MKLILWNDSLHGLELSRITLLSSGAIRYPQNRKLLILIALTDTKHLVKAIVRAGLASSSHVRLTRTLLATFDTY